MDELESTTAQQEREAFLSADRLQKLNPSKDNLKKSGFLSDEKLHSIMCYLDEVETAERISEIDQVRPHQNKKVLVLMGTSWTLRVPR